MSAKRKISYWKAINEALHQLMQEDKKVFLMGQGIDSPWHAGRSTEGISERFGKTRVIDTPVSENGLTGFAIGAALAGMKPILTHARMDFMLLSMDQIVNHAANWRYMFGGKANVPIVIRGTINRGGEQAAQHSQALQALFAHIPGLKVVMPSTPFDAKGLLVAAVNDGNPVIFIDDRWLYEETGDVPEKLYSVPIGKAIVRKRGKDVSIVAISFMAREAMKAAIELEKKGISAEVIDLRSLKPFDSKLIEKSVKKTHRLVVCDSSWKTAGAAAEIVAFAAEKLFPYLKAPIERVCLPDCPAPSSSALEKDFYTNSRNIIETVKKTVSYLGKTKKGQNN